MPSRSDLLACTGVSALFLGLFAAASQLPFWNSDDWFHLNLGAGLLALDPAAWEMAFRGDAAPDAAAEAAQYHVAQARRGCHHSHAYIILYS